MPKETQKTTVNQAVWKVLQSDIAIQKDLARKLLNVRALAKHILHRHNVTASLDAVISAIRRYQSQEVFEEDERALQPIFADSIVSTRNNMACLTLSISSSDLLRRLCATDKHVPIKFTSGTNEIKVIIDAPHLPQVLDLFDKSIIRKIEKDLSEISLTVSEVALGTKGVLARVASEVALANINIHEILICPPEFLIYVKQKDIVKAHDSILRLCHKTGDSI